MPRKRRITRNRIVALLGEFDLVYPDLGEVLDRGTSYIQLRVSGKESWLLDEVYKLRAYFNSFAEPGEPEIIPIEKLLDFFPPLQTPPKKRGA